MKTKLSLVLAAVICVGAFAISEAQSAPASFTVPVHAAVRRVRLARTSTYTMADRRTARWSVGLHDHDGDTARAPSGVPVIVRQRRARSRLKASKRPRRGASGQITCGPDEHGDGSSTGRTRRTRPDLAALARRRRYVDCPDVPTTTTAPTTTTTTQPPQVSPAEASNVQVAGVVVISPTFTG